SRVGGATLPPLYERLTFGATATGPQEAVYRALKEFQGTNLLHEIRTLKVGVPSAKGKEKADPKTLELDMTVEALVVNGAEERSGGRPRVLRFPTPVLANPPRNYDVLSKRSLFTGLAEPAREVVQRGAPKKDPDEEDPEEEPKAARVSERERLEALEFV